MNTKPIKLFDADNNLVPNFEEEVRNVLKSVHGDNYFDTDEDFVVEKETKIINDVKHEKESIKNDIKLEDNSKNKVSFKDFIPVLFFVIVLSIIIAGGYYFLNSFDFMSLIK